MKLTDVCKEYFSGVDEIVHFKENDAKTNVLAGLKFLTYLTGIIPLGFAAAYGIGKLYGRVIKKDEFTPIELAVIHKAKKVLKVSASPAETLNIASFLEIAKRYANAVIIFGDSAPLMGVIAKKLNDPAFQADPSKFMQEWEESSASLSEDELSTDDEARQFFQEVVIPSLPKSPPSKSKM